jgi:signal transduction histidine kinase
MGTRMELAIAKKCIEFLAGKISVNSRKSVGTSFKINLPIQ